MLFFHFKFFRSLDAELSEISVDFDFLICADICIPEKATLVLDLSSASSNVLVRSSDEIYHQKKPKALVERRQFKTKFKFSKEFSKAYIFQEKIIYLLTHQSSNLQQLMTYIFEITVPLVQDEVESFSGILSIDDKDFNFEEQIESSVCHLWQAILFALIGGLILNLNALCISSYFFKSFELCFYGWR